VTAPEHELTWLDEVTAVTREYATYSRTAHGLALVVAGAWLFAAAAMDVATRSYWATVVYLFLPPVWLVTLGLVRSRYQRRGAVLENELPAPFARKSDFVTVWFWCTWTVVLAFVGGIDGPFQAGGAAMAVAMMTAVAATVAVPVLMREIARGVKDSRITSTLVMLAFGRANLVPAPWCSARA
jgi:hypothetical protein